MCVSEETVDLGRYNGTGVSMGITFTNYIFLLRQHQLTMMILKIVDTSKLLLAGAVTPRYKYRTFENEIFGSTPLLRNRSVY